MSILHEDAAIMTLTDYHSVSFGALHILMQGHEVTMVTHCWASECRYLPRVSEKKCNQRRVVFVSVSISSFTIMSEHRDHTVTLPDMFAFLINSVATDMTWGRHDGEKVPSLDVNEGLWIQAPLGFDDTHSSMIPPVGLFVFELMWK